MTVAVGAAQGGTGRGSNHTLGGGGRNAASSVALDGTATDTVGQAKGLADTALRVTPPSSLAIWLADWPSAHIFLSVSALVGQDMANSVRGRCRRGRSAQAQAILILSAGDTRQTRQYQGS